MEVKLLRFVALLFLSLVTVYSKSSAQTDTVPSHVVYMIGDAGSGEKAVLNALENKLKTEGKRSSVIFLGNNISPNGLPKKKKKRKRKAAEKILDEQIEVVRKYKGQTYFIPGDQDWNNGNSHGRAAIKRQEDHLQKNYKKTKKIHFYPNNACGDPKVVEVSKELVFLFLDTQWWLEDWRHEPDMNHGCAVKTRGEWLKRVEELINEYRHEQLVIFMHHPPYSNGIHGGKYSWKQHLFPLTDVHPALYVPLPGVGSLYPIIRQGIGQRQDIDHPLYQQMMDGVLKAAEDHRGIIFVSGHDNSLQYHEKGDHHFIVSGSGSRSSYVRDGGTASFTSSKLGYAQLTQMKDRSMTLTFFDEDNQPLFKQKIADSKLQFGTIDSSYSVALPDSFSAPAFAGYKTSKFVELFMGKSYRDVWTTPVNLPVLDISQFAGGLTPILKGGGFASNSLRLKDKNGKQYAMRSVNKDLANVLPSALKKTVAADVLRDQVVANYTYGALPIGYLSNALGIYHTNAKLYYVPKQPGLGDFNSSFGNELYWLEDRPSKSGKGDAHFGNSKKIVGYNDLILNLETKQNHTVDQKSVLRARMFDTWVHDWDRHDDQWRWASFKEDGKTIYRPIPRDRDQAFYQGDGLLPWMAYTFVERKFVPFRKRFMATKGQPFNARNFDRYYLTELDRDDWTEIAEQLANDITDEMIDSAMLTIPKEVRQLNAEEFSEKLKARKKGLLKFTQKIYKDVARDVDVVGTDKNDLFEVVVNDDRSITVSRYYEGKKKVRQLAYTRKFIRKDTRSINIYALEGKDRIVVSGNKRPRIKVRIIGGLGKDVVRNDASSAGWLQVYDDEEGMRVNSEKTILATHLNDDVGNNAYDRASFVYDRISIPFPSLGFTLDDGFWFGSGFTVTTQGWKKLPYATKQTLDFKIAPGGRNAFEVNYQFDLTKVFFKTLNFGGDLSFAQPVYLSFFGYGNNTTISTTDTRFNWVRMHRSQIHPFLRYQTNTGKHSITVGPTFRANRIEHFAGRITEDTSQFTPNDFEFRTYVGLSGAYEVNTTNSDLEPTRGLKFSVAPYWNDQLESATGHFGLKTALSVYLTFGKKWQPTLATRVGFDIVAGDPEVYHYPTLGVNTYLRGFRNDRFLGDKLFYTNVEWRLPIVEWGNRLLPMKIGVGLAADLGRVWFPGQSSQKWHSGYTGSISVNILDFIMIVPSVSYSAEDLFFNFGTGWSF